MNGHTKFDIKRPNPPTSALKKLVYLKMNLKKGLIWSVELVKSKLHLCLFSIYHLTLNNNLNY